MDFCTVNPLFGSERSSQWNAGQLQHQVPLRARSKMPLGMPFHRNKYTKAFQMRMCTSQNRWRFECSKNSPFQTYLNFHGYAARGSNKPQQCHWVSGIGLPPLTIVSFSSLYVEFNRRELVYTFFNTGAGISLNIQYSFGFTDGAFCWLNWEESGMECLHTCTIQKPKLADHPVRFFWKSGVQRTTWMDTLTPMRTFNFTKN